MAERQILVAANWKMNGTRESVRVLIDDVIKGVSDETPTEVAICPTFVHLSELAEKIKNTSIKLGAQNVSHLEQGAYTGEVSALMLNDFVCEYVIVGHSERRTLYHETDIRIAEKFAAVQKFGMIPILCVGELLEERESNCTEEVIARQLDAVIDKVGIDAFAKAVIAYEPVWAIGTGLTPTLDEIYQTHEFIKNYDTKFNNFKILYGGSVKASNAKKIVSLSNVDGALIGGASLKHDEFGKIIED